MTGILALIILAIMSVGADLAWFTVPTFALEIVLFFALSNLTLYWVVVSKLNKHPEDFIEIYLGAIVLRILFFGGFIFAAILLDPPGAPKNTLFFLLCYFLFTVLEVAGLWFKIKSQKTASRGQKDH